MGVLAEVRWVAWLAVLVFAIIPTVAAAQAALCPSIHVKVLDIRNNTGTIGCALFQSPTGFPKEFLRAATNVMVTKIQDTQVSFDFVDIRPGTYALVVVHDENMNGQLDTNLRRIPTEGYGFSNNAKASLGAPSFSAASFQYDGESQDLTISLHY